MIDNQITGITVTYIQSDVLIDALEVIEQLYNATPIECRKDIEILSETIACLKSVSRKITKEEGFEMIYNLDREEINFYG